MAPDETNDFAVVLREKPYILRLEKAYSLRLEKDSNDQCAGPLRLLNIGLFGQGRE
jgi:hypothetical protein